MLKHLRDSGHQSAKIGKVWHYLALMLLVIAMVVPAAVLSQATPVDAAPVDTSLPAPTLISPLNGALINSNLINLTWSWSQATNYQAYQVEWTMDSSFSDPRGDMIYYPGESLSTLENGTWYWRVRAVVANSYSIVTGYSPWSPIWHFTYDTVPPAVPAPVSPANGSTTTDTTPALKWNASSGAASYEWQMAHNINFSPVYSSGTTTKTGYTFPSVIPNDIYYWRVRAKDAAGNLSGWSAAWYFLITPVPTTLTVSSVNSYPNATVSLTATLTTTASGAPVSGKSIGFTLRAIVPYKYVGNAVTNASGMATLNGVSLNGVNTTGPGWIFNYEDGISASFGGDAIYSACSGYSLLVIDTTQTPPPTAGNPPPTPQPGGSAVGGGWYSLNDNSRVNFAFMVNRVPNSANPIKYKGDINLINDGKWRLKGTLNSYTISNSIGTATGSGQLYSWNSVLNKGKKGWVLAQDNVSFTISFVDGGTGKGTPDKFGINIDYTSAGGVPLPNSSPIDLKSGNIHVK
jgi:hypothetical protein